MLTLIFPSSSLSLSGFAVSTVLYVHSAILFNTPLTISIGQQVGLCCCVSVSYSSLPPMSPNNTRGPPLPTVLDCEDRCLHGLLASRLPCPALAVLPVVNMVIFRNGNFDLSSELAGVLPHNAHTFLPAAPWHRPYPSASLLWPQAECTLLPLGHLGLTSMKPSPSLYTLLCVLCFPSAPVAPTTNSQCSSGLPSTLALSSQLQLLSFFPSIPGWPVAASIRNHTLYSMHKKPAHCPPYPWPSGQIPPVFCSDFQPCMPIS